MEGRRAADLVLTGGRVLTMTGRDPASDGPTALAVRGNRIVGIGSDDAVEGWIDSSTQVRRLSGHAVTPGLFDSHNHMLKTALGRRLPQVGSARDVAGVLAVLADARRTGGAGQWIECSPAWHESRLAEGRMPGLDELDAAVPDAPVFLRRGGHNAVLNTAALKRLGLLDLAANPAGATIVKDDRGRPTGHLIGAPFINALAREIPAVPDAVKVGALRHISEEYLRLGITSVVEPGLGAPDIAVLRQAHDDGQLPLRTHAMWRLAYQGEALEETIAAIEGHEVVPAAGDAFSVFGIKLSVDGGTETGYYRDPYLRPDDESSPYGKPLLSQEELIAIGSAAARHGWHVGVHCVGDAAIDQVLAAWAEVDRSHPLTSSRWSLIHMLYPRADQWSEVNRLGMTVTAQQPLHYALGEGFAHYLGDDRAADISPLATYLRSSELPVGGGSDSPVAPFDPWVGISSSVTRTIASGRVLGAQHAVPPLAALQMYTAGSAYCAFQEDAVGQLRSGMLADLLVLDADPFADPSAIPAGPLTTILDGKVVHDVF